ncbi:hypothetical protein ACFX13_011736 [Malus domestica]
MVSAMLNGVENLTLVRAITPKQARVFANGGGGGSKSSVVLSGILDVVDTTLKLEAYSRGMPGALAELKLCSI